MMECSLVKIAMSAAIAVKQPAPSSPIHEMNEAIVHSNVAQVAAAGSDEEEAVDGAAPASSFTPVLSKSAKRRARAKLADAFRAEEQYASFTMPLRPPSSSSSQRFITPPPAAHLNVHYGQPHSAGGSMHHSASPLPALAEMFPTIDSEVLSAIFQNCGRSFEATVEYMLANDAAQSREEKQMQSALNASLAAAALEDGLPSVSPPVQGVDNLSLLSGDLFSLVCENLNLFDLTNLASTSRDARSQVELGSFASRDRLDLGRYASWPDWKLLRMLARFSGTTIISFRNTSFKSFEQLAATCFGRHIKQVSFAGCHNLQDLDCNELFGLGEHLESLDLSQCDNLTDDGLEYIATARQNIKLSKLSLTECRHISSLGVERILDRCVGLQTLDLKGTNVSRSILQFTQQHSQLTSLNLSTCRKLPADFSIVSPFCQLSWLSISANPALKTVTLSIPTLTHLNLSNAKHVQSLTLYTPRLKVLNMNGCLLLSSISSYAPASKVLLTSLETINANLCRSITSFSFHQLLSSAKDTLKSMAARGCLLMNDANIALMIKEREVNDVAAVASSSSSSGSDVSPPATLLEFLDLSGCKSASASVVMLASRMVADANAKRELRNAAAYRDSWAADNRVGRAHGGSADSAEDQWSGGLDEEVDSETLED